MDPDRLAHTILVELTRQMDESGAITSITTGPSGTKVDGWIDRTALARAIHQKIAVETPAPWWARFRSASSQSA